MFVLGKYTLHPLVFGLWDLYEILPFLGCQMYVGLQVNCLLLIKDNFPLTHLSPTSQQTICLDPI